MRYASTILLIALAATFVLPGPALADQDFADRVDAAIEKGVAYLLAAQNAGDGSWTEYEGHEDKQGMTPLVCYALMEAGVSPQNEQMKKALAHIAGQSLDSTYGTSLRAVALQVANEQTNDKYISALKGDVAFLGRAGNGQYGYNGAATGQYGSSGLAWDHSNDQYAVLGVRAGAENGLDIRNSYWQGVQKHWFTTQNPDGGWGYNGIGFGGYYSSTTQATMTVGGLATLFICEDNLPPSSAVVRCNNVTMDPHIQKGLDWLDAQFAAQLNTPQYDGDWDYYYLYGVERAALASGIKYFGGMDWYKAGGARILSRQSGNGSWGPSGGSTGVGVTNANTAFSLLFLIRGKQPLIFNKLQFNGDWNNRSRDLAAASRWLSKEYEQSVNWQIVQTSSPLDDWRDAPILYISGNGPVSFTALEVAKLREYVHQGGTILSVAEAGGAEFNRSIRQFYQQAFPKYSLAACQPGHRLYTYPNKLDASEMDFFEVSNGVRPLAIHVENDLSLAWQKRETSRDAWAFEATANIVLYSVESLIDLPRRGVNLWPGGQSAAFVGSTGSGPACDWIYLMIGGQISPIEATAAGQTVTGPEGPVTVPQPDAPGRTIVYAAPSDEYISVPNELLGQTIPTPDGQQFLAQAPVAAAPTAPTGPTLVTPSPNGRTDVTVIRLQNANDAANCDPEPLAWNRFAALMAKDVSTGVAVVGPVDITDVNNQAASHGAKLAVLTGTKALALTTAEQDALKQFIEGGGTIFIDAAGGSLEFADSIETLVTDLFGRRSGRLRDMSPTEDPLLQLSGHEIKSVEYRVRTAEQLRTNRPALQASYVDERPVLIFSPYDVTSGLVGFNSGAIEGYTPVSAFAIMRNVVLSAGR